MAKVTKEIKVGSTVEYLSVGGRRKVKVLRIKPNSDLILQTAWPIGRLCKNVCVKQSRVTFIK